MRHAIEVLRWGMDPIGRFAANAPTTEAVRPARTLWTVQALRGVAALMVVIGHTQSAVGGVVAAAGGRFERSLLLPWGAGVDLFFVISGFIMVHASARLFGRSGARGEFLKRRLVRIVPLYWLVTTLFLMLLAAATLKGGDPFPSAGAVLASYAFIPADIHGDGRLFPVFDLGWTLNYEMFFYALLFLFVAWPRERALPAIGIMLAALVAIGMVIPGPSAGWFWTRPIILDFGLGVFVGAMVAAGIRMTATARIVLAILGTAALLADPARVFDVAAGTTVANEWPRVLVAGVPIAALLAAAVLGAEPHSPRAARPLLQIGDASYSLYLFHPFALIVMEKLAQKSPVVSTAPGWTLVAATVALAIAVAMAAYRWIERPVTLALSRAIAVPRAVLPPGMAAR